MPDPICPFARPYILHGGNHDQRPTIIPIATALHIAVSTASGDRLGDYFNTVTDDSTFYIEFDGTLWQFNPVNRKANAQFDGNAFTVGGKLCGTVSIETEGMSGPLTPAQVAKAEKLYAWLFTDWSISLDVSSAWNGAGAGWHSKYHEWNYDSHDCPKAERVEQLVDVVLPNSRQLIATGPSTIPQEDDTMKPVAGTPSWCGRQNDGAFPRFKATPDGGDAVVVSIDNAPFTPAWSAGSHSGYTDFAAYGLWCRRFPGAGEPYAFAEVAGAFFLIADHGTFDIAHEAATSAR